MARLTVIADDLTGALDTGVQFANRCVSVRVAAVNAAAVPEEIFHADVAVIDAEVRHKTSQQAYNICLGLVQQALRCGTDTVYIKTDSGLRGNIGAMFQAALDAGGAAVAYYAPALPQMNRLTRGGIQYIDGVPIDKSVFGQDPFEPVHSPYVKDLFRNCRAAIISCRPRALPPPPQHGQQIVICDAEKDTDFRCIAMELQRTNGLKILGGCAGFAAVLPPFLGLEGGPISLPCINAPLLVLCGSLNPITKRQLEYGAAHGAGGRTMKTFLTKKNIAIVLAVLLVVVVVVLCIALRQKRVADTDPTLTLTSQSAGADGACTVDVVLSGLPDGAHYAAASLAVAFDPTQITFLGTSDGDIPLVMGSLPEWESDPELSLIHI